MQDCPERLCLRIEARLLKLGCDMHTLPALHATILEPEAVWITKKLDIQSKHTIFTIRLIAITIHVKDAHCLLTSATVHATVTLTCGLMVILVRRSSLL
jgi:hypothetical protein